MPRLRKILFYGFVLVYAVGCPIILLYATGHITRTGLISLSSHPSGAYVYINSRRFSEKTPTVIRGLVPGEYSVSVNLKGYQPWKRVVFVETEQAIVYENILLLPLDLSPQGPLCPGQFDNLIPVRGRYLLLVRGPLIQDLFLFDFRKKNLFRAADFRAPFSRDRVLSITPREDRSTAVIRARSGLWGRVKTFDMDANEGVLRIRDEMESSSPVVDERKKENQIFWMDENKESHLLFRKGDRVYFLETLSQGPPRVQELFQVRKGSSIVYDAASGKIYFLEKEGGRFCMVDLT
ncbi:MAG: PEGA domain-containing protein [Candidatus Omnitrophica bacterium]|nr:PEGA domain-containing protein [Candidatus Omnitrophota bacterium]